MPSYTDTPSRTLPYPIPCGNEGYQIRGSRLYAKGPGTKSWPPDGRESGTVAHTESLFKNEFMVTAPCFWDSNNLESMLTYSKDGLHSWRCSTTSRSKFQTTYHTGKRSRDHGSVGYSKYGMGVSERLSYSSEHPLCNPICST